MKPEEKDTYAKFESIRKQNTNLNWHELREVIKKSFGESYTQKIERKLNIYIRDIQKLHKWSNL